MSSERPVVGLVCGVGEGWKPGGTTYPTYAGVIEDAGGVCLPLGTGRRGTIADCDGLFVPGGWDVHPKLFDRLPGDEDLSDDEVIAKYRIEMENMRDAIEMRLMRESLDAGKPFLGICRGFQVLNILLGRKFIPDIDTWMPGGLTHYANDAGVSECHEITIQSGSIIERCYGTRPVTVNSRHHQGMTPDLVCDKLQVTALAPDGVVEAVEGVNRSFVVGVQWHPERKADDYIHSISGPLFKAFVEACTERRRRR